MERKDKQVRRGIIAVMAGCLCLLAALCIWAVQKLQERRANTEVTALMEIVLQQPQYEVFTEKSAETTEQPERKNTITKKVTEHVYGVLQIEALELCLPILDTWNEINLQTAPCRYAGTAEENNLILLGHNYANHFAPLEKACPEQEVHLMLSEGRSYIYTVRELIQIGPEEIEKVHESGFPLTIFTCTRGGEKRWVLNCSLQE